MNMKTLLIILSIVTFVTNIHASTVSTYKRGSVKLISDNSATKEKRKNVAEKKARAKEKEIAGVKIEIPPGAKHHGIIIDPDKRIMSLCGFEIGTIVKVPRNPTLDDDGNIIMTGRLAKPFLKCTHYELKYSKLNHALYSIRVFSAGQKKMDEEAMEAELDAMVTAFQAKYENKNISWIKGPKVRYLGMFSLSFQQIEIKSYKTITVTDNLDLLIIKITPHTILVIDYICIRMRGNKWLFSYLNHVPKGFSVKV